MGMFGPSVGYSAHECLAMLGGISHNVNILVKPVLPGFLKSARDEPTYVTVRFSEQAPTTRACIMLLSNLRLALLAYVMLPPRAA